MRISEFLGLFPVLWSAASCAPSLLLQKNDKFFGAGKNKSEQYLPPKHCR